MLIIGIGWERVACRAFLCSRLDSNQHVLTDTTPSRWRVYRFHHVSDSGTNIVFSLQCVQAKNHIGIILMPIFCCVLAYAFHLDFFVFAAVRQSEKAGFIFYASCERDLKRGTYLLCLCDMRWFKRGVSSVPYPRPRQLCRAFISGGESGWFLLPTFHHVSVWKGFFLFLSLCVDLKMGNFPVWPLGKCTFFGFYLMRAV